MPPPAVRRGTGEHTNKCTYTTHHPLVSFSPLFSSQQEKEKEEEKFSLQLLYGTSDTQDLEAPLPPAPQYGQPPKRHNSHNPDPPNPLHRALRPVSKANIPMASQTKTLSPFRRLLLLLTLPRRKQHASSLPSSDHSFLTRCNNMPRCPHRHQQYPMQRFHFDNPHDYYYYDYYYFVFLLKENDDMYQR